MIDGWVSKLRKYRAIAVIRASHLELGWHMANAVAAGGVKLIEITWNSSNAGNLINKLRSELPDCIIGTGTVLNLRDLNNAISAGAEYVFTPHVDPELITASIKKNIPMNPGALTPTEIISAWNLGVPCIKVFPVQSLGGANYIKSLQGPLGHIPLIPTGGVTLENAHNFLQAGAIAVGVSSELFPKPLIETGNWDAIVQNAQTLVQMIA
ncbi:bifunctional 4-hydroxy-2-oxoglutarate aldolase/2-dehydro-3-deoxy-phosphogluconate aldolase [Calothrix sp. UHCC 0171]|uniref:bifunctional 4-hydroxy-2-oxoglutarate aldolase/2-dehydro-3-deoxy-phosphogluconate aldolase n=1 Tax=Calothrix sp. UHCC 0171 TaxID=3110245 RepID=UPI002B21A3D6|nr:bifunctional 4-hydroxy-2-oxoglutarate aldolase/2-dehydro-3-deoxy-phosphogluconate aldolase [Calothrix sp. UHCC 0171]MEA5573262.1 bifunctional 4-hydroxy-2-oxoglutarate aldolase/2-dehydro-3-deoxy-phosphogluconate aldolase [Calothrix sp. UHCC 0171]